MRYLALVLGIALAAFPGGCAERLGKPYRVKIRLDAVIAGQPRSLSQVFEIQHWLCKQSFCAPKGLSGDAMTFETGANGILVAPIEGRIVDLLYSILDAHLRGESQPRDIFPMKPEDVRRIEEANGPYGFSPELFLTRWLLLTNASDPATGRYFDLYRRHQEVVAPIIWIRTATIETTSDPVTRGIGAKLPWIGTIDEAKPLQIAPLEALDDTPPGQVMYLTKRHFTETRDP